MTDVRQATSQTPAQHFFTLLEDRGEPRNG
jgi:hypothetical protein